ncbi:MAG: phosphopantetheine-binding protein [Myxococcota bacterium]
MSFVTESSAAQPMDPFESEIKQLIVEALALEEIAPEDIETDAPLFVKGLGLDSIDALELAIAIDEQFGVEISAEDADSREIFASVRSLARHVAEKSNAHSGEPQHA